jgi:hypothetical protein
MNDAKLENRNLEGFEARLLPVLLEVVEERAQDAPARPRVRRRTVARAAVLAVAALVGAVVAANTLAVGTDTVQVSAVDAARDPAAVEKELGSQGIEARILVVPAPDLAGTWVDLYFAPGARVDPEEWSRLLAQVGQGVDPGLPPDVYDEILDHGLNVYHREVLEIPRDVHGPMTLIAGRAWRPGDGSPLWLGGELSPIGAFWCMGLEEMDPTAAERVLENIGYRVRLYYSPQPFAAIGVDPGDGYVDLPPPRSAVFNAGFLAPTEVEIDLVPGDQVDDARVAAGIPPAGSTPPPWAPGCPVTR